MGRGILAYVVAALASGCYSQQYPPPDGVTHWYAERTLQQHYSIETLQAGADLWCEATDGRFCPLVRDYLDAGEFPNVKVRDIEYEGAYMGESWGIELRPGLSEERVKVVFAHELGHAIQLQFDDGCDPEGIHSCDGLMDDSATSSINSTDLDAFEDVWARWQRVQAARNKFQRGETHDR